MLKSKLNSVQLTSKLGSSASDYTDCPQLESSRPIQTPKYKYFHILHHKQRTEGFISFPFCPSVRVNVKFEENLDRLRMWAGRTVHSAVLTIQRSGSVGSQHLLLCSGSLSFLEFFSCQW